MIGHEKAQKDKFIFLLLCPLWLKYLFVSFVAEVSFVSFVAEIVAS